VVPITNGPVSMLHWVDRGTGFLEHLKIQTRLIDEKFASVMGEYVFLK
jgi:hypothetical protein